jgi:hypothetical protein
MNKLLYRGQEVKVHSPWDREPFYAIIHPHSSNEGVLKLYHENSPNIYCGLNWVEPYEEE